MCTEGISFKTVRARILSYLKAHPMSSQAKVKRNVPHETCQQFYRQWDNLLDECAICECSKHHLDLERGISRNVNTGLYAFGVDDESVLDNPKYREDPVALRSELQQVYTYYKEYQDHAELVFKEYCKLKNKEKEWEKKEKELEAKVRELAAMFPSQD